MFAAFDVHSKWENVTIENKNIERIRRMDTEYGAVQSEIERNTYPMSNLVTVIRLQDIWCCCISIENNFFFFVVFNFHFLF